MLVVIYDRSSDNKALVIVAEHVLYRNGIREPRQVITILTVDDNVYTVKVNFAILQYPLIPVNFSPVLSLPRLSSFSPFLGFSAAAAAEVAGAHAP